MGTTTTTTARVRITRTHGQANLYMTLSTAERAFLVSMSDAQMRDMGYAAIQQYRGVPDNGVWITLRRPTTGPVTRLTVVRPTITGR